MTEALSSVEPIPFRVALHLEVTDPEVVAALREHPDTTGRTTFALAALRVGVLALRTASGQVDAHAIREAGADLVARVRDLLTERATAMTGTIASALAAYLDPKSGALQQRLERLLCEGGELDAILESQVGSEGSVLAQALAKHVGEQSPIFRMLSPTDANGLKSQLEAVIGKALEQQRAALSREFSLDVRDSALSRLVAEVTSRHTELRNDLKEQVATVVGEFSLDQPDSALSRLVGRVEATQRAVADQFSADNDDSALSRMTRVLDRTSDQIGKNLTLDDPASALSRLKRELEGMLENLGRKNTEFQAEVRETLASLDARKKTEQRSALHGAGFEERLGKLLEAEAQSGDDIVQRTGNMVGNVQRCKVGDHVVELGAESVAAGARIVWEAKANGGYDLKAALAELEVARKNREAQIGVFVFDRARAPEHLPPFSRYGKDLVVVWDAQDPTTDLYVQAAWTVAKALVARKAEECGRTTHAVNEMDGAVRAIERQVEHLEELVKHATSIETNASKIVVRVTRMRKELEAQITTLDDAVSGLRLDSSEAA